MKEKNFKFKESFSYVINSMDDRQAGKFIKALTNYAFNGQVYTGKDTTIKSAFALVKVDLDMQKFFRETGRLGYDAKERNKKKKEELEPMFASVALQGETAEELVKTLFGVLNMTTEKDESCSTESVAK